MGGRSVREPGDDGFSLVELIVTAVVVGIAFVAIVSVIWTSVRISDYHRKTAVAETHLRTYAEHLKSRTVEIGGETGYKACAGPGDYPTMDWPADSVSAQAIAVEYWDPGSEVFVTGCAAPSADVGVQRVQLEVISTTGTADARETTWIVKRDPTIDTSIGQ